MRIVHVNCDVFPSWQGDYDTTMMRLIYILFCSIVSAHESSSSLLLAGTVHSYAKMRILNVVEKSYKMELSLQSMTNMKEEQHKVIFTNEAEKIIPHEKKTEQRLNHLKVKKYSVPLEADNSTIKLNLIAN